jgi:hypothetical protein
LSRDSDIGAPLLPLVVGDGNVRLCGDDRSLKGVPQPASIATFQAERTVKYPRLVTPAWMHRIQALIFDLLQVDDGALAVWQPCHDIHRAKRPLALNPMRWNNARPVVSRN